MALVIKIYIYLKKKCFNCKMFNVLLIASARAARPAHTYSNRIYNNWMILTNSMVERRSLRVGAKEYKLTFCIIKLFSSFFFFFCKIKFLIIIFVSIKLVLYSCFVSLHVGRHSRQGRRYARGNVRERDIDSASIFLNSIVVS